MVSLKRKFESFGALAVVLLLSGWMREALALRPLRERGPVSSMSWGDERLYLRRDGSDPNPYSRWNITGTYRGRWSFSGMSNGTSRFLDFGKSNGMSVLELMSTPTKINGVHYIQDLHIYFVKYLLAVRILLFYALIVAALCMHSFLGAAIFHDVHDKENDLGVAQMRVEGVYIWPFKQLRLVATSGNDGDLLQEEHFMSNPYHLLGAFSSQVFQESPRERMRRRKTRTSDMEKHCNVEIAAQVTRMSSSQADGEHDCFHLEGLMESPAVEDDGECFSPIMINVTSLNVEIYYNKAVNYTLMVTFISFFQVLLLIRQMEHSNTQSGAAKVSMLMIGQQAIMDAYLCLLHLTAGILVESLFNAFATAAFFKFVVFSIFEMRYLLAIWKASRPLSNGEGWETMRRELSVLYSRFYGVLLCGILVMYQLHRFLRPILFMMYSFWVPQIINNVIRDTRKPLHPHYVLGMTVTRLAIPLYVFGCPSNFMRTEVDSSWCISLSLFMAFQSLILLLQHYLGSRWFIPRQILPEKYSYSRRLESISAQATDCVICMTTIDLTHRSVDYMVTPCDHFFHSGCLQRWMDIKMECPTCRRSLPPA